MSRHIVQVYGEDEALVREAGGFLAAGLDAGGAAICIATPEHRRAFEDWLGPNRVGHRWIALDARRTLESLLVDGWPDERRFRETLGPVVREALTLGRGRLVAFGEMVALLVQDGESGAALALESMWNGLQRQHGFGLWCAYPLTSFVDANGTDLFVQVCRRHTTQHPMPALPVVRRIA